MKGRVGLIYPNGDSQEFKIGTAMCGRTNGLERPVKYYIHLDTTKDQTVTMSDALLFNEWIMRDVLPCLQRFK